MTLTSPRWKLLVLPLAATVALVGCGNDDKASSSTTTDKPTTTAASNAKPPSDSAIKALTATLAGGGSSFADAFEQAVNTDFNGIAGKELVTYAKSGSTDGRKQLAAGTLDFAGTDSLPKPEETFNGKPVLFFPTVAAPITVSYNLSDVKDLQLSPDTAAKIFQGQITTWNDPAIAADNPGATLPTTNITVVHRSDGSGTTSNFTKWLASAAPGTWTLGSGDTVNWPATTQGAEKNSGVAASISQTAGALGYVDLADALKAKLAVAKIKNAGGKFVGPSADGVNSALESAEVADNLTYNPINAPGDASYPITSPTFLLVFQAQPDAAKATSLKTYLQYVLTTGQEQASSLGYVALPPTLQSKSIDQISKITG